MMARNAAVPLTGRIQKRKTNHLRTVIFGLQRAAGPYRRANSSHSTTSSADRAMDRLPSGSVTSEEIFNGERLNVLVQTDAGSVSVALPNVGVDVTNAAAAVGQPAAISWDSDDLLLFPHES